jgi:tRNA-specific 2-thiouridylase
MTATKRFNIPTVLTLTPASDGAVDAACPVRRPLEPLPRLSPEDARELISRYDVGPIDGNDRLVVVAMSGGVDSAVTALVLRERGYRVVGMNMRLFNPPDEHGHVNPCCSLEAMEDARATCRAIDVPFYPLAMQQEFEELVIDKFVDEYANGRTPNPCLECNRHVKFKHLIARAKQLGADHLATGHYARIEQDADGTYHLYQAVDERKDQSYVLHTMSQEQLRYLLFPLGRLRKPEVRELARGFGLPVADKPESQDICFVGKGSYAQFVAARRPGLTEPGEIVSTHGEVLGQHRGLLHYTVGQRKGLGIAGPEPHFVLRLDTQANRLVVGTRADMAFSSLMASGVTLTAGEWPTEPFDCAAVVRYRGTRYAATVEPLEPGKVRVHFAEAPSAIAPGQAVVFYRDDEVLGGGTIASAEY